jgi:GTPase SAR1 family protein
MYFRDSAVALVCYSPDRLKPGESETGSEMKALLDQWEDSVGRWIGDLRDRVDDCVVILVTTKWDLLENDQAARNEWEKRGETLRGQFCCFGHYMTSAKTGGGVDDLALDIAGMAADPSKSSPGPGRGKPLIEGEGDQSCC